MLHYCGDNCFILSGDGSLYDKIMRCIVSGGLATGPRPQHRFPALLTKDLIKKMTMSNEDVDKMKNLSENAQKLALKLGQSFVKCL